jgi:hypothetical protein
MIAGKWDDSQREKHLLSTEAGSPLSCAFANPVRNILSFGTANR